MGLQFGLLNADTHVMLLHDLSVRMRSRLLANKVNVVNGQSILTPRIISFFPSMALCILDGIGNQKKCIRYDMDF